MPTQRARLQANGLNFSALVAGPRDGPVALLLHGFPEGKESWEPQLEALAKAGWRAVAPDLRGYGGTDVPEGVDAYTLRHLVQDVQGLVHALGEDRVDLVGHDWGSLIGWSFTSRHPSLVRTWSALSVPHPTVFAAAAGYDGTGHADPEQQEASAYVGLFVRAGKAEEVLLEDEGRRLRAMFALTPNPTAVSGEEATAFFKSMSRPGRLTAALNYYRANWKPGAYAAFPPCPNPIRTPTLMVWGTDDTAVRRRAVEATADEVQGYYRLEALPETGHWLTYERPDVVSRLLVEHVSRAGRIPAE